MSFDPYVQPAEQDETSPVFELECDIILYQADYDSPTQITRLLAESFNCAVIDCGASRTVCGKIWLQVLLESIPKELTDAIQYLPSKRVFKFGDGKRFPSEGIVIFPAVIGNSSIMIEADIVDAEVPLLFSKDSLKKAGMAIDFKFDTVDFLNQCLPLSVTSSGHYILPITKYSLMLNCSSKPVNMVLTAEYSTKSKKEIAWKLHRQFAHAPTERIIKLLKSAKEPWNEDKDLFDALQSVFKECETCNKYQTALPRPVVGLPMASKFKETVAMDIKTYDGKYILIDHATRLSTARRVPNKQPETIVKAILHSWISVYGPSEKFLTDNGGEFVNEDLIALAESFGIIIKTTGAEAPWSNGLVERHNRVLGRMLNNRWLPLHPRFGISMGSQC